MALVLWFAILLLPCVFFALAAQGQIVIPHANVPDPESHPLLEFSLISEAKARGLRIVNTSIIRREDQLCVQTSVRFLLWEGEGEAVVYCDCYRPDSASLDWSFVETLAGECQVNGG